MNQLQDDLALSHLGRDPWTYLWKFIFCSLLILLSEEGRARIYVAFACGDGFKYNLSRLSRLYLRWIIYYSQMTRISLIG